MRAKRLENSKRNLAAKGRLKVSAKGTDRELHSVHRTGPRGPVRKAMAAEFLKGFLGTGTQAPESLKGDGEN